MILGAAFRAFAFDKPVRQKHILHRIVQLLDTANRNQPGGFQFAVNILGEMPRFGRVGAVIIIKLNMKAGKIAGMFQMNARNQSFRCDTFLLRTQHDRRTVRIVGAHIINRMSAHFLKTHPDIRLNIFHQMT